jgi:ABC-type transport system involved in multi-copper enzyme maturation permease subunit
MNNIWVAALLTIRETFSRKIFILFAGVSTLVLLLFGILFISVSAENFPVVGTDIQISGMDIGSEISKAIKLFIVNPLYGLGIFLAIFSVSSIIPQMLEKGNIDLLLSKPISRTQLILGKFFGGNIVVLANLTYLIFSLWLMIGIKFGDWDLTFLWSIVIITFVFAVLYAMIILIGIISNSSILAMMISYLILLILSPILANREFFYQLFESKIAEFFIDGLYYFIPKTAEISNIISEINVGMGIEDFQPILSSFAFLILNIALSIIIFSKKDY